MEGKFEENPNYLKNHFTEQKSYYFIPVIAYESVDDFSPEL